jgi:cyclic dehypoxanthinyl futalosine synthase
MSLDTAIRLAEQGQPLCFSLARILYDQADLLTLGQLAHATRLRHNPAPVVTYAVDRNINYTNVCVSKCAFCAFYRTEGQQEAYVLDDDTLARKLEETKQLGGTHILFQGGLNPDLDLDWHLSHIRMIRSFGLGLHGYSPPEIVFLSERFGLTIENLLERFVDAGLGSIPGGGAEILVDRVRRKVSPGKTDSQGWFKVMLAAHRLGLKTTATMMFGHVERPHERLVHLFRIRQLQDKTNGFTAFIPWPYQPGENTIPANKGDGTEYLRVLAMARLVLDNVPHIQASWVTQGPHVGQVALLFGADDLGSTMIEENVVAAAGVSHAMDRPEMVRLVEEAGFTAQQRDVWYRPVEEAS